MGHVTGLGGVFVKSADPGRLMQWYRTRLGVEVDEYGARFEWRDKADPEKVGYSVWSVFKQDSGYFNPSDRPFMVNLRVGNLDALLAELRAAGCEQDWKMALHTLKGSARAVGAWRVARAVAAAEQQPAAIGDPGLKDQMLRAIDEAVRSARSGSAASGKCRCCCPPG